MTSKLKPSDFRAERGSRSSSIPATPAPTPNPLLYVSNGVFRPEQLAAGISCLRGADEGYVDDSASFPATPSPSPFSPSPAQIAGFTPDQVQFANCTGNFKRAITPKI